MTLVHRVLPPSPIESLDEYLARAGGRGIERARSMSPAEIIAEVTASGLRGRGGAGFPTGRKWQTIASYRSNVEPTTVVVNGAEGEPGTFKDRTILRLTPYAVVEGALIAARAVEATEVIFALKERFHTELARLRAAVAEVEAIGWAEGVVLRVFEGPTEYLYGEETALLEVIDGRQPFPRIAPPYRRGVTEIVEEDSDVTEHTGLSAHVEMAGPESDTGAPPTLASNVETIANVARILDRGAAWFRTEGTDLSPGTLVCTVTGSVRNDGVGEVIMGTTLREAITEISGGPQPGHTIKAVMSGVSNALMGPEQLDTPLTYEDMTAAGFGLGSGGFIVFDDTDDLTAVAAGASRFLAVESCGQCTPCKIDGLEISEILARLASNNAGDRDVVELRHRLDTVVTGARCNLATQQQVLVSSVLDRWPEEITAHEARTRPAVEPVLVAEMVDIGVNGAEVDERFRDKQPDWSYDRVWDGKVPADEGEGAT